MATFDRKDDYLYIRWAKAVKQRDFHCCQICGFVGGSLNSHHLNAWASYPDQRYDTENGVTLCTSCHDRFHEVYGKGENTEEQFEEFTKTCELLKKTAQKKIDVEATREAILSKLKDGYG